MSLPFLLQKKGPRAAAASEPLETKLLNADDSELLEHSSANELMRAVKSKDARAFRAALEAIVGNHLNSSSRPLK